jgi:hypothetical protein
LIGAFLSAALVTLLDGPTQLATPVTGLTIDPCAGVDDTTVREVVDMELDGVAASPGAVSVGCVDGNEEIRIQPNDTTAPEAVRTIPLSPISDNTPAARQARARELALAIAEFIRREQIAPPAPPAPVPPPLPLSPPQGEPAPRWQLGLAGVFDDFTGGRRLLGGDLQLGAQVGRRLLVELRAGARVGQDESLPDGRLTTRAGTVAAALGAQLFSSDHALNGALLVCTRGYLVQLGADVAGATDVQSTRRAALAVSLEPRATWAIARRFSLQLSIGVGFLPRGIRVRKQGSETQGFTGFLRSGNLAGVLSF